MFAEIGETTKEERSAQNEEKIGEDRAKKWEFYNPHLPLSNR